MSQITFDTLEASGILREAGASPKLADAIATLQKTAIDNIAAERELATKKDLIQMEGRLAGEMAAMKAELLKYMINMFIGLTAVLGAFLGVAATIVIAALK